MPPLGGQVIVQLQTSPSAWPSKKSRLPEVAASWAPAPLLHVGRAHLLHEDWMV